MSEATTKVVTALVRFSYPHLFEPYSSEEGKDKKYSMCVIIPKSDTATKAKFDAAVEAAKEAGKSAKNTGWAGKIPRKLKLPLRDGDDPDEEKGPEFANCWFFNCSANNKPGVIDKDNNAILDKEEIYAGCYGRVAVNLYAFGGKGTDGVGAGLNNVQKIKDGERLGGGNGNAVADFAEPLDLVEEDDDDLLG